MYVLNTDGFPPDKIYECNSSIADWLMIEKQFPLLGRSTEGKLCFAKTDTLMEILETLPFYLKISEYLW